MGKRLPETEAGDRTRPDATDATTAPASDAPQSSRAGNNMEKDGNYTWTPAQERKGSVARRVAALV